MPFTLRGIAEVDNLSSNQEVGEFDSLPPHPKDFEVDMLATGR